MAFELPALPYEKNALEPHMSQETLEFFFSSRRRHTRLTCDWSSDVCSSDLNSSQSVSGVTLVTSSPMAASGSGAETMRSKKSRASDGRSEERRVGKECRTQRATIQLKQTIINTERQGERPNGI